MAVMVVMVVIGGGGQIVAVRCQRNYGVYYFVDLGLMKNRWL